METQVDGSSLEIPAEMVANAFVQQYYNLLHEHPDHVHRFYNESSTLARPGGDGLIMTVTGMEAIKDLILSVDYTNFTAEIVTVDAQASYRKGVIVIVTGRVIGNDHGRRNFTESFFLAPQENGYFVLNDVFRYVDEDPVQEDHSVNVGELHGNAPSLASTHEPGTEEVLASSPVPKAGDASTVNSVHEKSTDPVTVSKVRDCDPPREEEMSSIVEVKQLDSNKNVVQLATISSEDTPKKSYASIVRAKATNTAVSASLNSGFPSKLVSPTADGQQSCESRATGVVQQQPQDAAASSNPGLPPKRVAPTADGRQSCETRATGVAQPQDAAASPESPSLNNDGRQKSNVERIEDKGYSVYIGDLPHDATVEQVENEFKKFGAIKRGGVQVRCNKGFFYGFVEFESLASMEKAIEAATITVGGNEAFIQEKRTTTRVTDGGNSFPPRRGGYHNDNYNGRSYSSSGGRGGYMRNSHGWRNEYGRSNYGRNNNVRNDYHNQNGAGRGGRQGGAGARQ